MEGGLCFTDYAVIAVFFAAMIGVGLWTQRSAKDASAEYMTNASAEKLFM